MEYHSPVTPKTPEAFIVHKADFLDAYIDASPEMRGMYYKWLPGLHRNNVIVDGIAILASVPIAIGHMISVNAIKIMQKNTYVISALS